jgi:hypothetical protein
MKHTYLDDVDEIVESELSQFWLGQDERLYLGCPPIPGLVAGRVGAEVEVPYQPHGDIPELAHGPAKGPQPAIFTVANPHIDEDWADDPTLRYWVTAQHHGQYAARFADHFARSRGTARLVLSNMRAAVVYPTKLFTGKPESVFTTFCELSPTRIRALSAHYVTRSIPSPQVLRLDFTDGSTLMLRDQLAGRRVARAHQRMH